MRRLLTILLSAILILTLSGCAVITSSSTSQNPQTLPAPVQSPLPPQGIAVNEIAFEKIDLNSLDEVQMNMIELNKSNKGYCYWQDNDSYYIVIFAGEQPTGGHEIDVKSIEDNEGKTNILVEVITPKDMSTQVITYPFVIIKVTGTTDNFNILDTEGEAYKLIMEGC